MVSLTSQLDKLDHDIELQSQLIQRVLELRLHVANLFTNSVLDI